ncbi:hypothetical protein [Jiella marina]|uniref:hypothetical protein n=1 Tax=Jiella sp. LLJ827 TaxID=2917712 RepID=UPI00210118A8|nr:hypothetical protein [Jiella sp. LLJ827]MCQ0986440.1 hypothetical protein [Jiella sp. LLJ827]
MKNRMLAALSQAATRQEAARAADCERLRRDEAETIGFAAEHKQHLADSYWHERHRAESRLTAAKAVRSAIAEIAGEARRG